MPPISTLDAPEISAIVAAIPQIVSGLVRAVLGSVGQLASAGVQLLSSLVHNLPQIISSVVVAIPQIITAIVNAVGDGVGRLADAGANLVRGLWNGIQSLAGWLWDRVSGWVKGIWDGITNFFGIHSPSRKMAWVGDMLVRGLSGSIDDHGHEAVDAAESMAADTLSALDPLTDGITVPMATQLQPPIVPDVDLTPPTPGHGRAGATGGWDVTGVIEQTARTLLAGMDISVRLNDGTLVGKLTPAIDQRLAQLSRQRLLGQGGGI